LPEDSAILFSIFLILSASLSLDSPNFFNPSSVNEIFPSLSVWVNDLILSV
jgi:hypothetical protein